MTAHSDAPYPCIQTSNRRRQDMSLVCTVCGESDTISYAVSEAGFRSVMTATKTCSANKNKTAPPLEGRNDRIIDSIYSNHPILPQYTKIRRRFEAAPFLPERTPPPSCLPDRFINPRQQFFSLGAASKWNVSSPTRRHGPPHPTTTTALGNGVAVTCSPGTSGTPLSHEGTTALGVEKQTRVNAEKDRPHSVPVSPHARQARVLLCLNVSPRGKYAVHSPFTTLVQNSMLAESFNKTSHSSARRHARRSCEAAKTARGRPSM